MTTLTDPLLYRFKDQCDLAKNHWQQIEVYNHAYRFMKQLKEPLTDQLMTRDWGTLEDPGTSLWILRGLVNSAWKKDGRVEVLIALLDDERPLPPAAMDLWTHPWNRQRFLCDLAAMASQYPLAAEARLFEQFLTRFPETFRWAACDPSHLIGPKREGWVDQPGSIWTPEGEPEWTHGPNYEGEQSIFYSFLSDLVKPKNKVSEEVLGKILALDPMVGEHAQTREKSLMEVAVQYRSKLLQTYASRQMAIDHTMHSQSVDRKDRNLPTLLIGKRRWKELREMGLEDPNHLDETGHTYLHRLIESWIPTRWVNGTHRMQKVERELDTMMDEIPTFIEGWETLISLGCDPSIVCAPKEPFRLSKSGNRKGWPIKWREYAALPGETPLASLQRRAQETWRVTFPGEVMTTFIALMRESKAKVLDLSDETDPSWHRPRTRRRC